jgi:hypothetical protein
MKKWVYILIVTVVLLSFLPTDLAKAQASTPVLKNKLAIFELDLRPEFDHTGVLVVYHMVLSSDTKLPATLTIRIPQNSGGPSKVASVDPIDGSMTNIPPTLERNDIWYNVTFTSSANEIDFEYYDPALNIISSQHTYQYTWNGDFNVENFSIYIQQPVGASSMSIIPALGSPKQGDNNIVFYYSRLGAVVEGTQFTISMKYIKQNADLSVEQLQVKPSVELSEKTPGRTTLPKILPWLIGILGLLLILGLLWWIWLARHAPRSVRKSPPQKHLKKKENSTQVYCPQCGQRAEKEDTFCRICGTRLKK